MNPDLPADPPGDPPADAPPDVPGLPADDGAPVFTEPWQAQAFAIAVALHERGVFTWPQWAAALTEQIAAAQASGDPDSGDTYYQHWLATLELMVQRNGLAGEQTLHDYRDAWRRAAGRTPHGRPIELLPDDVPAR